MIEKRHRKLSLDNQMHNIDSILVYDSPTWPSTAPVFVKDSVTVLPSVTEAVAVVNSILAEIDKQHNMVCSF